MYPDNVAFSDLDRLEDTIGIRFADRALLQEALVHSSFLNENPDAVAHSNERLEFLGDALLDLIVGEYLYQRFPEMDEGRLTTLRAALIKAASLARFAQRVQLGEFLLLSHGENESGGRARAGLLSDAFEALIAAIYLDSGLDVAKGFIMGFIEPETTRVLEGGLDRDYKSQLQEWAQRELQATPVYRTVVERGPDHAKEFTVEVLIAGEVYGRGEGPSKQVAGRRAAEQAWEGIPRGQA